MVTENNYKERFARGLGEEMLKPAFYVSNAGEKFPYEGYSSHGYGGTFREEIDLPKDEYPYSIEWAPNGKPNPKFMDFDDDFMVATLHNVMVFFHNESMEVLTEFKKRLEGKSFFEAKFMLAAINFVMNDGSGLCKKMGLGIFEHPLIGEKMLDVVTLMAMREELGLGADVVGNVVKGMVEGKMDYSEAFERALPAVVDEGELDSLVKKVLAENPDKVMEYRNGKLGLSKLFVGLTLKKKKGADPRSVVAAVDRGLSS